MARPIAAPTGRERTFGEDEIIVSKTDLKGRITYANSVFLRIAGYEEAEVLGQPHSIIRHPDMPRAVFKLLWETIASGREIFAYVKNMARDGDHYWVFAHVTPSFDMAGAITGYHSFRRWARRDAIAAVEPLYGRMLAAESAGGRRDGMTASTALLLEAMERKGTGYDAFILSL
ncbi:PAS domain-containing protein [Skermanella mucosa]|uniref:PAS domain-containing protein n=1 Tax=Skermanella mucosa TaxID=1789672 RepID=UPI00192B9B67|nr:PAS domain-containing protein [Skermanella mucosa]UEM21714.1 PAS domain-containing protein [Skermanella mucosa]